MSLTYAQVQLLQREVKPMIEGAICCGVVVISPRTFALVLNRKQLFYELLLCFQEPFLRFHLTQASLKSQVHMPFGQKISHVFNGKRIVDCSILNHDRILAISLTDDEIGYSLVAEFFPKRPNCYLLDQHRQILASLNPSRLLNYDIPLKPERRNLDLLAFQGTLEEVTNEAIEKHYAFLEAEDIFRKRKQQILEHLEKRLRSAKKRLYEREETLRKCQNWYSVHHEGMLFQANLYRIHKGMTQVTLSDWEQDGKEHIISLEPHIEPHAQVARFFKQSKKLRLGEAHAERLLKDAQQEVLALSQRVKVLEAVHSLEQLDAYKLEGLERSQKHGLKKAEKPKPYHVFITQAGLEVWVGKSAKDNDQLTFRYAKGSDWWLHARNYPGSHVVLRCDKGQEPDKESLNAAAELALRFSKCKDKGEGEVSLTQVKWLSRVKSASGKVMMSKHKVLRVIPNQEKWLRLKPKLRKLGL